MILHEVLPDIGTRLWIQTARQSDGEYANQIPVLNCQRFSIVDGWQNTRYVIESNHLIETAVDHSATLLKRNELHAPLCNVSYSAACITIPVAGKKLMGN